MLKPPDGGEGLGGCRKDVVPRDSKGNTVVPEKFENVPPEA
jgi:hypothetical protein